MIGVSVMCDACGTKVWIPVYSNPHRILAEIAGQGWDANTDYQLCPLCAHNDHVIKIIKSLKGEIEIEKRDKAQNACGKS